MSFQECRGVAAEALARSGVERGSILISRVLVEARGIRLAKVVERVADRVDHELVVAVQLLRVVCPARPSRVGVGRLGEELGLGLEEIELTLDEVVEAASPEDHVSPR